MPIFRLILNGQFIGMGYSQSESPIILKAIRGKEYRAIKRELNALHVKEHNGW